MPSGSRGAVSTTSGSPHGQRCATPTHRARLAAELGGDRRHGRAASSPGRHRPAHRRRRGAPRGPVSPVSRRGRVGALHAVPQLVVPRGQHLVGRLPAASAARPGGSGCSTTYAVSPGSTKCSRSRACASTYAGSAQRACSACSASTRACVCGGLGPQPAELAALAQVLLHRPRVRHREQREHDEQRGRPAGRAGCGRPARAAARVRAGGDVGTGSGTGRRWPPTRDRGRPSEPLGGRRAPGTAVPGRRAHLGRWGTRGRWGR